jgi:ribosomal protein L5
MLLGRFEPVAVNIAVISVVSRPTSRNSNSLANVVNVFRYISYIHILYNRYRQTRTFWVQENEAVSCMCTARGNSTLSS